MRRKLEAFPSNLLTAALRSVCSYWPIHGSSSSSSTRNARRSTHALSIPPHIHLVDRVAAPWNRKLYPISDGHSTTFAAVGRVPADNHCGFALFGRVLL